MGELGNLFATLFHLIMGGDMGFFSDLARLGKEIGIVHQR
jgi:hypothetical protein